MVSHSAGKFPPVDRGAFVSPAAYMLPERLVFSAWLEHAPFAAWLVEQSRPSTIVELGTERGFSYFVLCQTVEAARLDARCYAVDTWQGDEQSGFYGPEVYDDVAAHNQRYAGFSRLLRCSFDDVLDRFDEGEIDLLHIDGLHTYEAVSHDFQAWLPKLSERALVLLHDTSVRKQGFGVWRLWSELSVRYPHFEFTHGNGLGIVGVGRQRNERIEQLFRADEAEAMLIRHVYERLGVGVADREAATRLAASLADADAHAASLHTEAHRARADLAAAQSAYEIQLSEAQSELESVRKGLESAQNELASARRDLSREQGKTAAAEARLREIETSTTWRFSAPLRSFLDRHPRFARGSRRTLRRIYSTTRRSEPGRSGPMDAQIERGYEAWVKRFDTIDDRDIAAMRRAAGELRYKPLVSVVLPVHETPEHLLQATLDSVTRQTYENWELCIADDASAAPHVKRILDEYAAAESRVKVLALPQRGGISGASNAALGMASGEFVALLDHDDLLRPHALFMVARTLNRHPDAIFVYSDEDKIDERGQRYMPNFKPSWSPALFTSQNYLCHLSVFRRDRALKVGGFRPAFDGAQDWDLFLRVTRGVEASRIVHIPHVLYHWRAVETSTARSIEAKPAAVEAGTRAVADHLRAIDVEANVEAFGGAYQRVHYAVPDPAPSVEMIIPSACKHEYVELCLEGLLRETSYPKLHVTLVVSDTVRADSAAAALLEQAAADHRVDVLAYPKRPFNYSWVNNFAVRKTSSEIICLMNDDLLVIEPNWLRTMVGQVMQDRVAAVGAMLYYPDDRVQHGGVILGLGGVADHYHRLLPRGAPGYRGRAWCDQDLSCVTAGCMVLRREAFVDVGGFDEMFAVAFNDVDFCIRLREKGWRIVWTPTAELYHYESTSVGRHDALERAPQFALETELAVRRWNGTLLSDPYYNPNLSLAEMNELAFPPREPYSWRTAKEARANRLDRT